MFLEQAIRNFVSEPVKCLDLCAAPGGKSTHLLNLLPEGSLLVSNEVIRTRSNILAENITKWGNPNNIVTNNDPEDIGRLTHLFDVIVTDVPCSNAGMDVEQWGNTCLIVRELLGGATVDECMEMFDRLQEEALQK